jgi:hypothetical protein
MQYGNVEVVEMNDNDLIKALDESGHRESALLLKNWGEKDETAARIESLIKAKKDDFNDEAMFSKIINTIGKKNVADHIHTTGLYYSPDEHHLTSREFLEENSEILQHLPEKDKDKFKNFLSDMKEHHLGNFLDKHGFQDEDHYNEHMNHEDSKISDMAQRKSSDYYGQIFGHVNNIANSGKRVNKEMIGSPSAYENPPTTEGAAKDKKYQGGDPRHTEREGLESTTRAGQERSPVNYNYKEPKSLTNGSSTLRDKTKASQTI